MIQATDLAPKKKPVQARARTTVEAILDATARLLASEGYAAISTNRIAELAGVSIGSLYEYFPHKQSIVAAALARVVREIVAEFSADLRASLALPDQPRGGLDYWIRAMIAALEKRDGLLRVALREVPFLWDIAEVRHLSETLLHIAQESRHQSGRALHFDDPEASTYLLTSMVREAILQTVLYPPTHLSRERLTRALVDMVLKLA